MRSFLDDYWNTPAPEYQGKPASPFGAALSVFASCLGCLGLAVALIACLAAVCDTLSHLP